MDTKTVRVFQEPTRLYGDAPTKSAVDKTVITDVIFNQASETMRSLGFMVQDLGDHLNILAAADQHIYDAARADATDLTALVLYLMAVPLSAAKYKGYRMSLAAHFDKRNPGYDRAIQLALDAQKRFNDAYDNAEGGTGEWKDIVFNNKKLKTFGKALADGYGVLTRDIRDPEFEKRTKSLALLADFLNDWGTKFVGKDGNSQGWEDAKRLWPEWKNKIGEMIVSLTKECDDGRPAAVEAKEIMEQGAAIYEKTNTDLVTYLAGVCTKHKLPEIGDLDKQIQGLGPTQALKITCLGLMELLLRIVAQGCNSLDTLKDTFKSLRSTQGTDGPPYPKVAFACAGQNPGDPKFVITTSVDHWDWNVPLSNAYSDFRNHVRPNAAPLSKDASVKAEWRVDGLSTGARDAMVSSDAKAAKLKETPDQRMTRRIGLIRTWRSVLQQSHHHEKESGLPFEVPAMRPMARCMRCMHLFDYKVPQVVFNSEVSLLKKEKPTFNLGWLCAETYATYYCFAAGHVG